MRLCFTTEERFFQTPDGCMWSPASNPAYSYFRRYLGAFNEICVIARVAHRSEPPPGARRADGPGVVIESIPTYTGPLEYLRCMRSVNQAVRRALGPTDAVVLRIPSQIAWSVEAELRDGRPFGLELVGDPDSTFASGASQHPLRAVWRWWFTDRVRHQCARASAICYVTGRYLQQKYPPAEKAFCTSYQPMELVDEVFVRQPRTSFPNKDGARIITVGTLEQPYKGVDVLIDAVALAVASGRELHLTVVGNGRYQAALRQQAAMRGIENRVVFVNEIRNDQLLRDLDNYDLFVLASRTEGLPRVIMEAMARAMPCVASAVGGIPELLDAEDLVPAGDAQALHARIAEVLDNPARMYDMSARNLARARNYNSVLMDSLRQEFLHHLFHVTQRWVEDTRQVGTGAAVTAGN